MPYNKEDLRYNENIDVTSQEFKDLLVDISNEGGGVDYKIHLVVRALMAVAESLSPSPTDP